jgi:LEA14-like dessication related protein
MRTRTATLRFRPSRHPLPIALGAAALTACALFQRFSFAEPTVSLSAVRVTGFALSGGSLDLALEVHNPNAYALTGGQFTADVTLEDRPFGSVSRSEPWTLPARGDTTVTVHLAFSWATVGTAARAVLERGSVRYRLAGRVLITTPIDDRWVAVQQRGDVPVERLLP